MSLNRKYRGRFRLIKGIEANIRPDGSVDMEPDELRRARAGRGGAALGAQDRSGSDSQDGHRGADRLACTFLVTLAGGSTDRARASRRTGTRSSRRPASANVAIEIDGDPSRQDVDYDLAKRAVSTPAACSRSTATRIPRRSSQYSETAIAHARLAGVPADRVVNCWPIDKLLDGWQDRANRLRRGFGGSGSRTSYRNSDRPVISR